MGKKSKGFSELLRLQKISNHQENPLASLEKKVKKEIPSLDEFVVNPPGQAKMSEVLEDFVEPYREFVTTKKTTIRMLHLAKIAWNIALSPKAEQQERIDQFFGSISDDVFQGELKIKAEAQDFIQELVVRKNRYFSQYKRMIVDFELKDVGDGYYLSVASTLDEDELLESGLDFPPVSG